MKLDDARDVLLIHALEETDRKAELIADADRLQQQLEHDASAEDPLLTLPALSTLMDLDDYLNEWRDGAMNLGFAEELEAGLTAVAQAARASQREGIAELADAFAAAHGALADGPLIADDHGRLHDAHEVLLRSIDALAAGQAPVAESATIEALSAIVEREAAAAEAVEEDDEPELPIELETPLDGRGLRSLFEEDSELPADAANEPEPPMASLGEALLDDDAATPDHGRDDDSTEGADELQWADDSSAAPAAPMEDDFDIDELLADEPEVEAGPQPPADAGELAPADLEDAAAGVPPAEDEVGGPAVDAEPAMATATPEPAAEETVEPAAPAQAESAVAAELLPDEIDEEIIEVFFEEAEEILESLDESLHQWQGEPENLLHLEHMLRGLHTLKGGARLSGLTVLGDRTHQYESFLIDMQTAGTPVDGDTLTTVQQRFDELSQLVTQIRQALDGDVPVAASAPAPEPAPASAGPAPLRAVPDTAPAAAPPAEPASGETTPAAPAAEAATPAASPRTAERRQPAVEDKPADRAAQEMVRVGSGLLEELVNLAGESSIVRARIEQGISDFTGSLDEMETTIERVREQLRRLEIETEAQILFRQDRPDGPAYEDFDPLEMDRYSQLQQLSRALSESASDMLDLKDTLLFKARESETLLLQQARINTELQEGLMRTRMVPFNRLLPRLRRIVRQVATELGKEVELHAYNVDGELDRSLLERMVPPLEHMLRNAVDHGIESQDARVSFGKPAAGRIDLRLSREGGDIVIEISDDGAGIDTETVREKAIERGLLAADAELSDDEISQFVLAPGFSTAKSVTQISGRGVGMDVVHSEVKQLGGSISIQSRPGKGTRIALRVPFTVSVNRALMVNVGEDLYAIPLNTIEGIVLLSADELERLYAPDGPAFEYAGVPYRVRYLGHYLGRDFRAAAQQGQSIPVVLVLVRSGDHAVAVHVDGVQGSREIVVKSLGPQFAGVGGISGATILGDGSVVVILDLLAMIRAQVGQAGGVQRRTLTRSPQTRCVMVVDDSVTVRKVTSRLLERQGMDVLVAKDGIEAVALLQERKPDVMLLDIEMPRMDGFEVARQVRHDERLKTLPIIMISSRTGEKHQERALELGVNRFLGKPFQESELLATIDEIAS